MLKIGDKVATRLCASALTYSTKTLPFKPECWDHVHNGTVIGITDGTYVVEFDHVIYKNEDLGQYIGAHNYYGKGKRGQCCYIKKKYVWAVMHIPVLPSWDEIMKSKPMSFNSLIQAAASDRIMAMSTAMLAGADYDIDKQAFYPIGPEEVLLCL